MLNSTVIVVSMILAYILQNFYIKMVLLGLAYGCAGTFSTLFVFMMNEVTRRLP